MSLFADSDLQGFSDLAIGLAARDTAEILRYITIPDDQGGEEDPLEVVEATSPCIVLDVGTMPREYQVGEQIANRVINIIAFPRGFDVRASDKIRVNGTTVYRVLDLYDPTSYEVLRRVLVLREG